MFSQYFGHYLLNRGLVDSHELNHALELMKSTHVKLGVLAVNDGFMTVAQVEEIHQKQMQVDKRFGELAIEEGYLSKEQLNKLLSSQTHNHLLLGQALVDQQYMTLEQFSSALHHYKIENNLSDEQFEAIKKDDISVIINKLVGLDKINHEIYMDYITLFAKNIFRFIDNQVRVEIEHPNKIDDNKWFFIQTIEGETPLFTGIAASENVFLKLASIYAEETINEPNELAQASVSEFLNLHNGIFLVNMSNRGVEMEMTPQVIKQNAQIKSKQSCDLLTLHLSCGSFHLLISDQPENITVS